MVTVDASDGPLQNSTVDDEISDNVKTAVNFFQTGNSGESSGSQNSDSKSESGTSNSPGSNGNAKYAKEFKKTKVRNYRVIDKNVTHGNIPEKAQPYVNKMIEEILTGKPVEPLKKAGN